ncbi:MAG: PocR ligand-binding domain-containing protein [Clostridia bacterium]|nr:PocR ligand-binding domain-containing protein [Clostridia bacterium]
MRIRYQEEKLNSVINDFFNATGVRISVLDTDFNPISKIDNEPKYCGYVHDIGCGGKCGESDLVILKKCKKTLKPEMHICHAGLVDIAVPIVKGDMLMGFMIMGQMKRDIPFSEIKGEAGFPNADMEKLEEYYKYLYVYDDNSVKSIQSLAVMLTAYIMSENMISQELNEALEEIIAFIKDNMSEEITVSSLSKKFGFSKNTLYRLFEGQLGMPVNEYIIKTKIDSAKEMLGDKTLRIREISERLGIENYSYFAKIFKSKTGITPSEYRRLH